MAKELVAMRLNSLHNLHFFLDLMRRAREAIEQDRYAALVGELRASPLAAG